MNALELQIITPAWVTRQQIELQLRRSMSREECELWLARLQADIVERLR